ncbi:MAG: cyclase family protein [Gemmatimonadales bacterium]|nr:cyclase family protein [Gemmatimonadales bacterium]
MKPIDLSHTIMSGMPQWRGDSQILVIHRQSEHGPSNHMSSSLEFGCHVGTHIDAPLHFLSGSPGVDEMSLEAFGGTALVVDATEVAKKQTGVGGKPAAMGLEVLSGEDLGKIDFVLFNTGWDKHWGTDQYYRHWPWLSLELAEVLVKADLKGVGLDTPSLDDFGGQVVHDLFAVAGMINIENLTNLGALPRTGSWFQAFPLKLLGTEASPVRALAWVEPT